MNHFQYEVNQELIANNSGFDNLGIQPSDNNNNSDKIHATFRAGPAPTAVCVTRLTVFLDGSGVATITPSDIDNGSSDDLGPPTLSIDISSFDCSNVGSPVTVTLTATNILGLTDSCTTKVTVKENMAPVPDSATLADVIAQCSVTSLTYPTATDNCTVASVSHNAVLPITTQGTTIITWTYSDSNFNISTQTQNIIIYDNTAPTPDIATLADVTAQCSVNSLTPPTATDNCTAVSVSNNATLPITAQGTTTVTWTYSDAKGNSITQSQNIVITDNTAPVPDSATLADVTAQCSVSSLTPPTATDNCTAVSVSHNATLPISAQGTTMVIWTYSDTNGNSSTQTQNVIINDNTAPVPDVGTLANINAQCAVTSLTPPTATDNCTAVSVSHNATLPITAQGTTTVTWTYADTNGNFSTQIQRVVVKDTFAPVPNIAALPTIEEQCSAIVTAPTATDNCRGTIIATTSSPTNYNSQGTYTITWMYNDSNGNISTQTQTVKIKDVTAPVPNVATLPTITGQCSATVSTPTATDNCSGTITATTSDPINYNAQGTYTITWLYDDTNGNISSQTQTVVVKDTIAPVPNVSSLPNVRRQCSATVAAPRATDNCNGLITGTTSNPTSYTSQGTYTITWTFIDAVGNTSSQTQNVIINDTVAPVPNVASLPTITGQCSATVATPKASDNCNGTIIGTTTNPTSYTTQGTYTITWIYDDTNGNTSSQTQTVIVDDTVAPVADNASLPNINVQCSVTVNAPTATDNCEGQIIGTTSDPITYNSQGSYTITWVYNDGNGNTTTQTQSVIVKDTESPATPTLPDLTSECSLTVTPPTTTDNCDGIITGTTGLSSLTFTTVGTDIIYWDFTDEAGNSIIVPQNITITDGSPVPNITVLEPQVFDGCQIVDINYLVAPTATDGCDGEIIGTLNANFVFPYSFSGTQTIDWEFIDSYGNITYQPQDITLNPITVEGGTLSGTYQSTVYQNGIDISSCDQAISVVLNLSGQVGSIIRWEKFAVNHGQWEVIANTTNSYTASFAVGALESTYYRVMIQTGTCITYSSQFYIRALPVGSAPAITNLDDDALYCLGESVSLLATSTYTATQETIPDSGGTFNQGQLNTQDPNGWLVDGNPGGFTAGGSAAKPRNWSAKTCNNQTNGDIVYCSNEGKYTIAYGDYSSNQYSGAIPTTLETPILDLSTSVSASLNFDQAFYFANNDYANIEISTNGGAPGSYAALRLMHAPGSGILKWFTAGTAASVVGSDATHYNFQTDDTTIDLSAYLGETNVRIRWSFTGTTNKSTWAMDNIFVNKVVVVDTEVEWTDGIGNPNEPPFADGQTEVAFVFTPDAPGHHQYGTTALINNCRTYDEDGTALIDIFVSYSYAGENVAYLSQECGRNTVQLNAYDNSKSARENANKGAFTIPTNCLNCDDDGTNEQGVWSIADNSACGGGTFSNVNDPDALFTAEAGTYTLTWTVAGCSSNITVTTTNCNQINFDGTNDYVDFESNNFNFNIGNFSIEAWVKPESINGKHTIFSKRDTNGSTSGYDLSINASGIVSFNINQTGTISSSPHKINTNRWYHIALTYASGRYNLYIDGVLIKTNTGSAPGLNNFKALLGAMDDNSTNIPNKHFNGWIDEFRIWKVALTSDQLRQMMNQKIIPSPTATGKVQGEIIPVDINGLSWSNLSAYFQMEPTDLICGYLQSVSSSIKGKLKNITSAQTKSAPLPYTSRINGPWGTNTTWTNFQVWDAPNSLGIDGSTRIDWNIVRTNHRIISDSRDLTLLGLMVDTNELTITGPGIQNEYNSGTGLWVTHYLKINGKIDLVGESQLVQKRYTSSQFSDSKFDISSAGSIERDQQGTADKFTYNYWGSPVGVMNTTSNNNGYRVKDVMKDGVNNINWLTSGYNGTNTSPIGIADYWVWKFANLPDNSYASWQHIRSTGTIKAGEGFTLKGPGSGTILLNQNYVFAGKPNNGDINLTLNAGNDYLVANPYPSAIDGRQFILDNGNVIAGNGSTTGTLYFWEHWGGGSHNLHEYQGGYATYNLSGGTPSASFGTNDPNVGTGGIPTKIPGRYIPVSQGFFVVAEGSGGTIKFNNGQRIFAREGNSNSVFVRTSEVTATPNYTPDGEDLRMKFRIGFNSVNTIHRQLLLTVDHNATEGIDWGYDAKYIDDQMDDMYWMINNEKFNIQGRDTIVDASVVPLGLHLRNGGQNKISIDHLENVPDDVEIFVHDKLLNTYHNLRNNSYEFNLPAGSYLDRFEITFREGTTLNVEENELTALEVFYSNTSESLVLVNPTLRHIKTVEMFNILGQSICTIKPIENTTYSEYEVKNLNSGTYIVKMITDHGTTSKKVLVK
jgi:hypothetical protein